MVPTVARAANVGYYELCTGQGEPYLSSIITAGGDTPINITVPDASQLSGISALLVTNCDNGGYATEWTQRSSIFISCPSPVRHGPDFL